MAGGRNIMANEKQRDFIRSVPFLRHWPIERLREDPRSCTVYYFDRNQVLVRDSNNSDWIYIVLKGSLSVIKKLKRVEPQVVITSTRKRKRDANREPTVSKSIQRRVHSNNSDGTLNQPTAISLDFPMGHIKRLPPIHASPEMFKTPFELESKLEQTLPGYRNEKDRLGSLNYDKIVDNFRSRLVCKDILQNGHVHGQNESMAKTVHHYADENNNNNSKNKNAINSDSDNRINDHKSHFESTPAPTSRDSSTLLPDISVNNKTVRTAKEGILNSNVTAEVGNNHKGFAEGKGNNSLMSHNTGHNGAGDMHEVEREKDVNRRGKLKRQMSKTLKGVYLAPTRSPNSPGNPVSDGFSVQAGTSLESTVKLPCRSPQSEKSENQQLHEQTAIPLVEETWETIEEKLAKLQLQYQRRVIDREGRKTIAEELDYKARRDLKLTEADLDPTVIEVQVLERGQYFGLTPMLFPDQSSLSVVSNSAECLVMSKRLFMQWATEKCLRYLRQTESPFPSEQELNRKLQEMVNWQANRAVVYRKLASQIAERKTRRKQFLPSFQGQYCFRTGPA